MGDAEVLVVYYSRTGTTQRVAEQIAEALGCQVERIAEQKDRAGLKGFIGGGKDAMLKRTARIGELARDPGDYALVVVGTPVWAWTVTPAVRSFLERYRDSLPEVAFFLTTGGTGIERTFRAMEKLCGRRPVATLGLKMKDVLEGRHRERLEEFVERLRASRGGSPGAS